MSIIDSLFGEYGGDLAIDLGTANTLVLYTFLLEVLPILVHWNIHYLLLIAFLLLFVHLLKYSNLVFCRIFQYDKQIYHYDISLLYS